MIVARPTNSHLSLNIPAKKLLAMVLYDNQTRSMFQTGSSRASVAKRNRSAVEQCRIECDQFSKLAILMPNAERLHALLLDQGLIGNRSTRCYRGCRPNRFML
jgi:hypothetical protein